MEDRRIDLYTKYLLSNIAKQLIAFTLEILERQ